jgi:hypothetical protein
MFIWSISYHGHDFRLHLSHTRKYIRVNRVRDGELSKSLRLQPYQLVPAVVDSTADSAIFPPGMLHLRQLFQLVAHHILAPSLSRERSRALHTRARRDQLLLKLEDGLGDLSLHLCTDTRETQEDAEEGAADVGVYVCRGADRAAALQLVEELARPAQQEEDEDDIAEPASTSISFCRPETRLELAAYTSRFTAANLPPRTEARALKESRRLTGSLEVPGMVVNVDPQLRD